MIPCAFRRASAERFAELLDHASLDHATVDLAQSSPAPRRHVRSQPDDDLSALVTLSRRAAALPLSANTAPDPAFRAGLRAMLVATAERDGIGVTARPGPRGVRPRAGSGRHAGPAITAGRGRTRGAIVVGVAVGALALSGMSAASGDAVPGDPLYGVKRSTERAQLALAGSDLTRGQLYLEFARNRLAEAGQVHTDPDGFGRALTDMDADTRQGVTLLTTAAVDRDDPAALDAIDAFVTSQMRRVSDGMLERVSGASRARLMQSLTLLDRVTVRSHELRQSLSCGAGASTGGDDLGPRRQPCAGTGRGPGGAQPSVRSSPEPLPVRPTRPGESGATSTPSPSRPTQPAASAPAVPGEPSDPVSTPSPTTPAPSPGGGLLDSLNRIVEDLLGG